MNEPRDMAMKLLKLAGEDLHAAAVLLNDGVSLHNVVFLSQQVAEKALKSLLAINDLEYPKTHNLKILYQLLLPAYPQITQIQDALIFLTPISMGIRYGEMPDPTVDDASDALGAAKLVLNWITQVVNN